MHGTADEKGGLLETWRTLPQPKARKFENSI